MQNIINPTRISNNEYLIHLFPREARPIKAIVDDELDRLEYFGSTIFHEYPDKILLERMLRNIEVRVLSSDIFNDTLPDSISDIPQNNNINNLTPNTSNSSYNNISDNTNNLNNNTIPRNPSDYFFESPDFYDENDNYDSNDDFLEVLRTTCVPSYIHSGSYTPHAMSLDSEYDITDLDNTDLIRILFHTMFYNEMYIRRNRYKDFDEKFYSGIDNQ